MYGINYVPVMVVFIVALISIRNTKRKWKKSNLYEKIEMVIWKIIILWIFIFFLPQPITKKLFFQQIVINKFSERETINWMVGIMIINSAFEDYFKIKERKNLDVEKKKMRKKWVYLGLYIVFYFLFKIFNLAKYMR